MATLTPTLPFNPHCCSPCSHVQIWPPRTPAIQSWPRGTGEFNVSELVSLKEKGPSSMALLHRNLRQPPRGFNPWITHTLTSNSNFKYSLGSSGLPCQVGTAKVVTTFPWRHSPKCSPTSYCLLVT